ncbi:MAG: class I SAM-dependent methyltransferase [Polyangiaceae bacterium]|nr:class I SAM-dependent methyltransferase [Polyangiaceae bacterium]
MTPEPMFFDFSQLFDAEEYLYFMADSLREENTASQVDFLEQVLAVTGPQKILDLGCGHGRHAIELARRGHDVTGIDLVEGFLEVARKEAESEGVKVAFVRGDIGHFESEAEFDSAVCLFDAFGFFDDSHCIGTLRSAHKALKMGGRFVLDLRTREWMVRIPPTSVMDKGNGDMMIDRHHFDISTGRFVDRRTYVRDGKQREVMFSVRLFAFTEIRLILHSVGFEIDGAFGGFDTSSALSPNKPRTVIVCHKVDAPTASTA